MIEEFCQSLRFPLLDAEKVAKLEEDLSVEEIKLAIKSMQGGKSPGPDGYPAEFYKTFSDLLSPLLLTVLEESFCTRSLPCTMRQAVISLILKKDKNPLECGSYRPISLLNTDAKILAKILAQIGRAHV